LSGTILSKVHFDICPKLTVIIKVGLIRATTICDFLLVRHSNLGLVLHRFGDTYSDLLAEN